MVVTPIKYVVAFNNYHYYHNEGANRKAKRNKGDLAANGMQKRKRTNGSNEFPNRMSSEMN